ncbi:tyrosine-type recombinase/integrase [Pseudomonas sp. A-B-26]|uniref:tyrosine-type recombinase/integrase n=1 Tax=Pseudomonas sp. A-B-26 TaxID=2832406 RepID=UPI001CC13FB9|nr:site-specific integrase [Pseudomonas sp. A-B-26]
MRNSIGTQLFKPIKELKLFCHFALGKLETRDGSNIPFIIWPNGAPCAPANLYMLALMNRQGRGGSRGLSRRGSKGGSLGEYAAKLSPLIRYCYKLNIDFIDLTDQYFSEFISEIRNENSPQNPGIKRKSETTLLAVGRICLDFLVFIGRFYGNESFVSASGTIRTIEKSFTMTTRSGRIIKRNYLHHHSLTINGRRHHERDPITEVNIEKLRNAVDTISSSRHLQLRRHLLLSLLEHTGARRGEIFNITVHDINQAMKMKHPMLRLETWKQGVNMQRAIPVTKMLLNEALKYIQLYRKKAVHHLKKQGDHGFLFVSEITGKKLAPESASNDIRLLKRHAGIEEQICAHMFRHAFITNLFILLIKRHEFQNQDDFRRTLLNSRQFITEVMQWTGHRDPTSVERYIHLAFAKLAGYEATVTSVHIIRAIHGSDQAESLLLRRLQNGMPIEQYALELEQLKKLRDEDLKIAQERCELEITTSNE